MSNRAFSARHIYDSAQLGSLVRFYDGTPEPAARDRNKRAAWSNANGTGRLVRKTPASDLSVPGFKLHVGELGGELAIAQAHRAFLVSSDLRFAILAKPRRTQVAVLRDEGGILTLVHLARTVSDAESWLRTNPGYHRARIIPANVDAPRAYTYLHDADHGWLIVSRTDLDTAGLSAGDFSTWSRVCGDSFALDEYGDMPKFLKRLEERGIRYRFHDRRTKGDAHVRQYWFPNEAPAPREIKPSSVEEAPLSSNK
jgi:hypothetical protein